jgi:hypothetical protein
MIRSQSRSCQLPVLGMFTPWLRVKVRSDDDGPAR